MTKKIAFDTLQYARMLQSGGVIEADTHAASLAEVITHNFYTKDEVDKMVEAALKQFEARTRAIEKETSELENRLEKIYMRTVLTTVSILGTLIVITGAVSTFATHYFIH